MKKIDAMHHFYGYGTGFCGDCPHLIERQMGKKFFKCSVYGTSHSEASDWRKSYIACGLIDKPFPADEKRVINRVTKENKQEDQLPGQLTMDI